jgi:CubicO group peptidase (beta-lactamase class C family)
MRTDTRLLACCLLLAGSVLVQAQPTIDPRLSELHQRIASSELGPINSLLILHDGNLIHEAYYHGAHAAQRQQLFSVTKSVGATLIGMAERRGLLNPDVLLPTFFPDYDWHSMPYVEHADLRLHDLLTMRHGLDWDEWTYPYFDPRNSHDQMLASTDWYQFTLSRPRAAPPDSVFTYSTGVSNLMSGVLRHVSGLSPERVFVEWLAQPAGFGWHDWLLMVDPPNWRFHRNFPHGDAPMGVGLWLRPIDLLRLGELYLNRGRLEDQRLLDEDWIWRSWTPWSHAGNDPYFSLVPERTAYGYQWWYREFHDARGRHIPTWYAAGSGRQRLYVFPTLDLVVVSTSLPVLVDGPGMGLALREYILPLFEPVAQVSPQVSGLWFDPASPGQGFNLQQSASGLFGYYYGYAEGQPLWLVFDVLPEAIEIGRTMELTALAPRAGVFGVPVDPADGGVSPWGSLSLRFDACTRAHARLEGEAGAQAFQLHLLAGLDGLDIRNCTEPAQARPMADASGAWFDPNSAGQGWNLVQTPSGLVAYFYGYDQNGDPLWLVGAQASQAEPGIPLEFELLAGTGGHFDHPVPPSELETWGTVELVLDDCRNASAKLTGLDGSQIQTLIMLAGIPGLPDCAD